MSAKTNRRTFISLLGGAAAAPLSLWAFAARAQQATLRSLNDLTTREDFMKQYVFDA